MKEIRVEIKGYITLDVNEPDEEAAKEVAKEIARMRMNKIKMEWDDISISECMEYQN